MPLASRPVKLACLPCRVAKVRCDGQNPCASCINHGEECRYQPSRRGGARRGPAAAKELSKKRAQRHANKYTVDNNGNQPEVLGPLSRHRLQAGGTVASFAPVPITPTELSLSPPRVSPENYSVGIHDEITQDLLGLVDPPAPTLRAYSCDQDLINAYYIFIHPYFPLLPPPIVAQYEDKCVEVSVRSAYTDASNLSYWPTSPLGLAVVAILTLIAPPGVSHMADNESAALRRSYADLYARAALESLESIEPQSQSNLTVESTLHHAIPRKIEPILAAELLSLYECCQHGNIFKMRLRANQALTSAMDLSIHTESPYTGSLDAHRRCWWSTMFLVYHSSAMSGSPPLILFDDVRITTVFPEFRGCREPWPLVVNAQAVLLRSCCIARKLIQQREMGQNLPASIRDEISALDSHILSLATESDRFRCITNYQGAEADASRNLWAISNALIHTSRLTLHRVRAFPDRPIFFDNPSDFLAVEANRSTSSASPIQDFCLSASQRAVLNSLFPFTESESTRICLHSSLIISRVFRRLPSPNPRYSDTTIDDVTTTAVPWTSWRLLGSPRSIPYMAGCQLQSFYTLAMLLWQVHTAMCSGILTNYEYLLDRPSATTDVQDAERLMEELQSGMEALGKSIKADAVFGGVEWMSKEVEKVYEATLGNHI